MFVLCVFAKFPLVPKWYEFARKHCTEVSLELGTFSILYESNNEWCVMRKVHLEFKLRWMVYH